ncbi:MAG TPA: hypothetical protein V6C89_19655 [Drouetiella sp.]|jgi:hypothetical protein
MNAKKAVLSLLVAISSLSTTATFADTTSDVITPGALKKNGARKLCVCFSDSSDDKPQKTFLEGMTGEKVVWKKNIPLKVAVNTAKTDVIGRSGRLEIISQDPGSAAYTKQTFTWDGSKVAFVSKIDGDASQEQVDQLKKIALSGTQAQLDDFSDQDHAIFYPDNYITVDNVKSILDGGRKQALALLAAHKPQQAAQRMQLCLDASMELCYLEGLEGEKKTAPATWIEAWSVDRIALPASYWKPILKDYGTVLKAAGRVKESAKMVAASK